MATAWMTDDQKSFVITCLADYMTLSQIQEAFLKQYDREINTTLILFYDPTNTSQGRPGKRWIAMYEDLRKRAAERLRDIPVANPIYRLRMLQVIVERNVMTEPEAAMAAMEQAAREVGDLQERGIDVAVTQNIITGFLRSELSDGEYEALMDLLPAPRRVIETVASYGAEDEDPVAEVGVVRAGDMAS